MVRTLKDAPRPKRAPLPEEEAYLSILRAVGWMSTRLTRLLKAHGLTPAQYNILRILRGAGAPLPCLEVAHRLITPEPDITRLLDRMEKAGLITRHRSIRDRRVVDVSITPLGRRTLTGLDGPVIETHRANLGHMSRNDLAEISRLLEKAKTGAEPIG
ncbi:MAG: MarR family transcriptional regulator [Candidatus Zixiibacteriota bacterium]